MSFSSMLTVPARTAAPFRAAARQGASARTVAVPLRRRLPPLAAAASPEHPSASPDHQSAFAQLVAAGAKPTKTAVSKLAVAELRAECERLGLPADGLKAVLVDRLLSWWEAQRQQPAAQPPKQAQAEATPIDNGAREVTSEQVVSQAPQAARATPSSGQSEAADAEQQQEAQRYAEAQQELDRQEAVEHQQAQSESDGEEGQRQASHRRRVPGLPWMAVTWLGTSSGSPTPKRNVSAIAVQHDDDLYLVDAGEGTRHQMRRSRQPMDPARVRAIFITHTHGDHCFGLGGVIMAISQARLGTPLQQEPIRIYGPKELQSLVAFSIRAGGMPLTTPVIVTGLVMDPAKARPPTKVDASGMLQFELQGPDAPERLPPQVSAALPALQEAYDAGSEDVVQPGLTWTLPVPGPVRVAAAQLQHRVPCWGYVFQEPHTQLAAAPEAAPAAVEQDSAVSGDEEAGAHAQQGAQPQHQQGQQAQQGQEVQQQWVQRGRKLVILGDTCDSTAIAPLAMGCDLLSHEATFCSGMENKAEVAQHSTTHMAGAFAAQVAARLLVLTHFSARYESISGHTQQMKRERKTMRKAELRAAAAENGMMYDELKRLWGEAYETYGKPTIKLANDFFTAKVGPPEPLTVDELRQQELALQREAAAVLRGAGMQRGRRQAGQRQAYGQRDGRQREQHGQRRQQQWREPRQDSRSTYNRTRGGGGGQQWRRSDRQQQQWQQRASSGQSSDLRGWPNN